MTKIGSLSVAVEADAKPFSRGMQKAEDSVSRFTRSAKKDLNSFERHSKRITKSVSRSFKAMSVAALAAGAGFGVVAQKAVASADAMAKQAKAVDLTVERLQTLRFAFDRQGVAVAQTDKALSQFTVVLGRARVEGGMYAKIFEQAGISINQTTEGALNDAIAVLEGIEDQSTRAGIAAQLFGAKAGPKLAAAIGQGKGAIAGLEKEARQIGVVTNIAADRAERLTDMMTNMSQKMKTTVTNAILENAEAIYAIVDAAASAVTGIAKLSSWLTRLANNDLIGKQEKLKKSREEYKRLTNIIRDFENGSLKTSGFISTKGLYEDALRNLPKVRAEYNKLLHDVKSMSRLNSGGAASATPGTAINRVDLSGGLSGASLTRSVSGGFGSLSSNAEAQARIFAEAYDKAKQRYEEAFAIPLTPLEMIVSQAQERADIVNQALAMHVIQEQEAANAITQIWLEANKAIKENQTRLLFAQIDRYRGAFQDASFALKTFLGENSAAYKTAFAVYKTFATSEAIISGVLAVQKAAAAYPFPANIPGIAVETARAAANVASIQAQGYAKGVENIKGAGTGTSDSIPAFLSRGESVLTADATRNNPGIASALNQGMSLRGLGKGGRESDYIGGKIEVAVSLSPDLQGRVTRTEGALVQLAKVQQATNRAFDNMNRRVAR